MFLFFLFACFCLFCFCKISEKYNKTLVIITGGFIPEARENTDKIVYAMSDDLRNDKIDNIWRVSKIKLPMQLCECACLITNKSSRNPKLFVIGGMDTDSMSQNNHWEYELSQIVDLFTFTLFMMDAKMVCFLLCLLFFLRLRFFFSPQCLACVCACVCIV